MLVPSIFAAPELVLICPTQSSLSARSDSRFVITESFHFSLMGNFNVSLIIPIDFPVSYHEPINSEHYRTTR